MSVITFEILFIVLLLIANGVFAMSELAVVDYKRDAGGQEVLTNQTSSKRQSPSQRRTWRVAL